MSACIFATIGAVLVTVCCGFAPDALPAGPATSVAFELRSNLIVVPVRVNGVAKRFILDTGASQTVLDRATARAMQMSEAESAVARGAGGDVAAGLAAVESLAVGDATVTHLTCITSDLGGIAERLGGGIDGVIGFDYLSKFKITLDYRARQLTLHRYGADADDSRRVAGDQFTMTTPALTFRRPSGDWTFELTTPLPQVAVIMARRGTTATVQFKWQELHGLSLEQLEPSVMQSVKTQFRNFRAISTSAGTIGALPARVIEFTGTRDQDTGRFRLFIIKDGEMLWTIRCFAAEAEFPRIRPEFEKLTQSIRFGSAMDGQPATHPTTDGAHR